jgi:hypothetical protein
MFWAKVLCGFVGKVSGFQLELAILAMVSGKDDPYWTSRMVYKLR